MSYNIPGMLSSLKACGLVDKSLKILGGPTLAWELGNSGRAHPKKRKFFSTSDLTI